MTWADPDHYPYAAASQMAYREAQNLTDEQIVAARADAAKSKAHAHRLLAAAQGRDAGLADVQRERAIAREKDTPFTASVTCACPRCSGEDDDSTCMGKP